MADNRPTFRVPFGAGVDRNAGQYAVAPGQARALVDFLVEEGRIEARRGLEERCSITLQNAGYPALDIVHIQPFRAAGVGMVVAADYPGPTSGPNGIEFWRMSTAGFNPHYVGLMASPTTPPAFGTPRIFGTEAIGKLFYAHDEPVIADRRVTRVITSAFVVSDLTADLDGGGVAPVRFRGVVRYGDYLVGWGFASASQPDAPEMLRLSLPGDPMTFRPTRYALAGPKTEPVLNCLPGKGLLWVMKETETYVLLGQNATNFAIQLIDPTFGLAGSHLAVVVEDELFGWSRQGPRVWSASASVDLGLPLDLGGPQPADLVLSGEAAYGWAAFDAVQRLVIFGFPNRDLGKTRLYVLSRRDPGHPRWSYMELQRAVMSAGLLYAVASGVPTGYPDQAPLAVAGENLTVSWTNVGAIGDEQLEVWLKVGAGAYAKAYELPVGPAPTDSAILSPDDGVVPGAVHTVALRYRRGTMFTGGYAGEVTTSWTGPAVAQSVESITTPAAPPAPLAPRLSDCQIETIAGKDYVSYEAEWTDAAATGTTEVLVGTTFGDAVIVDSVAVSALGFLDHSNWFGGWWVLGGGAPRSVWVRHRSTAGVPGPEVFVMTVDPADGCAL